MTLKTLCVFGTRPIKVAPLAAGRNCELRFLGDAPLRLQPAAPWPTNWRVLPFGACAVPDFLANLDVSCTWRRPAGFVAPCATAAFPVRLARLAATKPRMQVRTA
jgi:hypothetical protein